MSHAKKCSSSSYYFTNLCVLGFRFLVNAVNGSAIPCDMARYKQIMCRQQNIPISAPIMIFLRFLFQVLGLLLFHLFFFIITATNLFLLLSFITSSIASIISSSSTHDIRLLMGESQSKIGFLFRIE
jgi:hypothetical protein